MSLGIIGCGKSAEVFQMPGLHQVGDISVVAVSDIDEDRLNRFAERFGIKHRFVDYHEMSRRLQKENILMRVSAVNSSECARAVAENVTIMTQLLWQW